MLPPTITTKSAANPPSPTPTTPAPTYQYDTLNRLTKLTNLQLRQPSTVEPCQPTNTQLAPTGRRTGVTETRLEPNDTYSNTGITYTYDTLNRLTQEASGSDIPEANFTTTYTYDLVGNRLQKATNDGTTTEIIDYSFNANDQLLHETSNLNFSTTYGYDNNGSLLTKIVGDIGSPEASYNFTYNLENRLSSAQITRTENGQDLNIATNYSYNQSGIRVKANSTVTNHTTNAIVDANKTFLIDPNNHTGYAQVLEEYDPQSSTTPDLSYVLGNDVISQATGSGTDFLMYDGHGSTRLLTNSSGNITNRMSYDAYGIMRQNNTTSSAPPATSLLYSGEAFDTDLQQQYLRARYYDQGIGRFNRLDPFEGLIGTPQSLNKYLYGNGNPISNIDPSGLFTLAEIFSVQGIQKIGRSLKLGPAFVALDRASTLQDATKLIAQIVVTGTVDPIVLGSVLGSIIPFGKVFKNLKTAGNKISGASKTLTKVLRRAGQTPKGAISSAGGIPQIGTKKLSQVLGELGAGLATKAHKMNPTSFRPKYHGIDGIFEKNGRLIIVEAKGGTSTLTGNQMSKNWINTKINKLASSADPLDNEWALKLTQARNSGNLQGMVVKTKINNATNAVKPPEFELKDWTSIGPNTF